LSIYFRIYASEKEARGYDVKRLARRIFAMPSKPPQNLNRADNGAPAVHVALPPTCRFGVASL
jgi:hypothetical protein